MAYFQAISRWILKKHSVITGRFISRSFNIAPASTCDYVCQFINFRNTGRPERDAALVGHVMWRLDDAKKLRNAAVTTFKLQPSFNLRIAIETKRRQKGFIE